MEAHGGGGVDGLAGNHVQTGAGAAPALMVCGSAEHTLDLLKDVVKELTDVGEHRGRSNAGGKLTSSIKNTMTDRAAVNTKFNSMLETYQKEIVSGLLENWSDLSDEEQASVTKVNNYFCGLHLLVNLAEQCNAVVAACSRTVLSCVIQDMSL